jgi:hypothetical protein
MYKYLLVIIAFISWGYQANAQILLPVQISYSLTNRIEIIREAPIVTNVNTAYLSENSLHTLPSAVNFKYTLPRGAIFCRMEEAIYNRLNFWVKFRMGTDERYSN